MAILNGDLRVKIGKRSYLIAGDNGIIITVSIPGGSIRLQLTSIDANFVYFRLVKKGLMSILPESIVIKKMRAVGFNALSQGKGTIRIPLRDFMPAHTWQVEGKLRIR